MKKTVLITGASGNLGQASVNKFLKGGYHVIATVTPGKTLTAGNGVEIVPVDLTNETNVEKAVGQIATSQTIDAVLLLAGAFAPGTLQDTDGAGLRKMIAANFETAYFTARSVFKKMMNQRNGGRIILVGSKAGLNLRTGKNSVAYALSKSMVFGLADLLNAEAGKKNIVAHVIVPSTIDTPPNRKAMPDADFSSWVKPEEIANAMYYLCSAEGAVVREGIVKVYGNV
jgi:NAD(P)-dependent dehydrogenase (short-subunit alcohol dehydrogenase family)